MDLSGIIFVALAIGWAVYLIPKALQREDEQALSRSVESFSDRLRVIAQRQAAEKAAAPAPAPAAPALPATKVVYQVSRKAAADAARRRRRVLGALVAVLAVTVGTSFFAVTPWWSTAVPATLIVAFLVIARATVKGSRRVVVPVAAPVETTPAAASVETEHTAGLSKEALAEAAVAPTTDAGGLWDPLPVTLPTYVNKARARRTVRTVELTGKGVTSSGHDAADSKIAAQHDEKRASAKAEETPARKVAGA